MAQNKYAASEDDVGRLHSSLTRLYNMKLDALMRMVERAVEAGMDAVDGDYREGEATFGDGYIVEIINVKDLDTIAKWVVERNGIVATPADIERVDKLSDKLAKLKCASKGNIIEFVKEA